MTWKTAVRMSVVFLILLGVSVVALPYLFPKTPPCLRAGVR